MQKSKTGFGSDLARLALAGYSLELMQMPFSKVETTIQREKTVIAVGVRHIHDAIFYSKVFWSVVNCAITKKVDNLQINSVADLKGHRVLAWQQAYLELGTEFETMCSPGAPGRANYKVFSPQKAQVKAFWQAEGDVIVITLPVFQSLSKEKGHSMSKIDLQKIFPPATGFRAGFKEADLRGTFNESLVKLCRSRDYDRLFTSYDLET